MDRSELLATIPLFESLSQDERVALSKGLEERLVEGGETVFKQGDQGGEMYLIESGAVEIRVDAGQTSVPVAQLFPGQYFGELSIFDGMPRSATATATKPTRLLWLGRDDLVRFIDANPE